MVELNQEARAYAHLAADLDSTCHRFHMRFDQEQAQAPTLVPAVEALVELE